ncbi:MAG: enoyl-CoA hydratase/isomerase family protein [Saprospiraceae bacterium]
MQTIQVTHKEEYAIVQMNRPKANAINQLMVQEIRETFARLEKDDTVRGVIITGIPNFFSAGLDLIELYQYDEAQIRAFFIAFGSMHIELVQFTKPLIAAITGYSPAGGTVIAVACDYRIMAAGDNYTIGLNEVAVNIQISRNLIDAYSFWLGESLAYQYILEGKLLDGEEALAAGLVQELRPLDKVLTRAEYKMQELLSANQDILCNTKKKLRKNWLANIGNDSEEDLEQAIKVWWDPAVRAQMKMFITMLTSKKKKS